MLFLHGIMGASSFSFSFVGNRRNWGNFMKL